MAMANNRTVAAAAAGVSAMAVAAAPAAAITCKDGYQLVQGNYISTPYCQDALLTRVAQAYGMRVSEAEIRNNFHTKRYVCRLIGRDIRVHEACNSTYGSGRRAF